VNSPGALQVDFAAIPYTKRSPDYWPRVADPFAS
jgi:microcystin degradation protein MlrC